MRAVQTKNRGSNRHGKEKARLVSVVEGLWAQRPSNILGHEPNKATIACGTGAISHGPTYGLGHQNGMRWYESPGTQEVGQTIVGTRIPTKRTRNMALTSQFKMAHPTIPIEEPRSCGQNEQRLRWHKPCSEV